MNIGLQIKELRGKRKITQEELAKALNVSTQAVSKWENGGYPDLELIPSIAKYFNVSTDYLFGREDGEILNIENKIYKYLANFKLNDRIEQVYRLGFIMSIATRGEWIKDFKEFSEDVNSEDILSNVISNDGIIITSFAKNRKIFTCIPKGQNDNYSKILESKEKQILLCKCLSDELFYDVLVFLYSKENESFTEQLLIDNFKITFDIAKDILEKMEKFNIVKTSSTLLNGAHIKYYTVYPNPQIVSLISSLDMVVAGPKKYCYYFGGPTDYFKKVDESIK